MLAALLFFIIIGLITFLLDHFESAKPKSSLITGNTETPNTIYFSKLANPEEFPNINYIKLSEELKLEYDTIDTVKEFYAEPKTMKVIGNINDLKNDPAKLMKKIGVTVEQVLNEQKQTRKARRISKRTNKTSKKRKQKIASSNKKSRKRTRVLAK